MAGAVVAAAVIPLQHHGAEAMLEVVMLAPVMLEVAILAPVMLEVAILALVMPEVAILALVMPGVVIPALEWGLIALDRVAGTSPAAVRRLVIGVGAITGTVATTGTAALVIGEIRMANGGGGTGTGGVIPAIMWSSLAILAFPGGGVGAGARGPAGVIPMDITGTAILTTAAMIIPIMVTATDTVPSTSTSLSTEAAANPELPSCRGDWHALVITTGPLTEFSDHKRGAQFVRTSRNTAT